MFTIDYECIVRSRISNGGKNYQNQSTPIKSFYLRTELEKNLTSYDNKFCFSLQVLIFTFLVRLHFDLEVAYYGRQAFDRISSQVRNGNIALLCFSSIRFYNNITFLFRKLKSTLSSEVQLYVGGVPFMVDSVRPSCLCSCFDLISFCISKDLMLIYIFVCPTS